MEIFYHFCSVDEKGVPRLGHGDNREVRVGETLTVDGPLVMCKRGLHASARLIDALEYVNDLSAATAVTLSGERINDKNKSVSTSRTCVAIVSADETDRRLRHFARWCALSVAHMWDMPEIVRRYLETGDESIRSAARDAARSAAWDAAGDAAWAAAGNAARSAAWAAAGNAAGNAARSAAWAAAGDAAWSAAWAAAEAAARAVQENKLRELFPELTGGSENARQT